MMDTIVHNFDIWTDAQGIKSRTRVKSVDNISLEGMSRLRALIIELALRGKLVPQDSTNEPANILLKKIALEKNKLIAEGKIPKQKTLKEIEQAKMPYPLSEGWEWAWFSDSFFFQEGPGIRNWQFRSSGIKLLNVQNIVGDKLILDNTDKYIDVEEYQQKYLHFTIEENDLVFASSGGSWGKSAFFHDPGYKVIVNTSTIRMHPFLEDSPRNYLKIFLDSKLFKDQMIGQLVGIQPNFGSTHLFKILVPVPPSKEQHLIASKVDELMALCDKLEAEQFNNLKTHQVLVKTLLETLTQAADANELQAAWERLSAHFDTLFCTEDSIDQLKQTILQLAVMGKLVKQDPNDEPASELLKKIAIEKKNLIEVGKLKKQAPLPKISKDERPFEVPKGWEWVRLGEVTNYGFCEKAEPGSVDDNTWVLELEDIEKDSSKLLQKIRVLDKKFQSSKNCFRKGDVIYGKLRPYLNKVLIADEDGVCTTEMIPLAGYSNISSEYLRLVLKSTYFINYASTSTHGMNLPRLGTDKARLALFPLTSLNEQRRIILKVNELISLCDKLGQKVLKSEELKSILSKTIVEKAVQ